MRRFFVLLISLFLSMSFAAGQEGVANIYGTVKDDSGSPLPGVNITLTGERIGAMTAVTTPGGNFRFLTLPIGNFQIKAELSGFKTEVISLKLSAGDTAELTIVLKPGTIEEEVTVIAPSPLVSTRKTTVSSKLTKEQYELLPAAKSLTGILDMIPGVMIDATDVGLSQYGAEIVGMGANRKNSTFVMDGGNVSSARFPGRLSSQNLNMNVVEEVEVTQGAHDVEAEAGGMRINFVTKRGGNRVSGDVYAYIMDHEFELRPGLPKDILEVNPDFVTPGVNNVSQYGFNIGGPIWSDHAWFFLSYNAQNTSNRTIANDEQRALSPGIIGKLNFQYKTTTLDLQYQRNKSTAYFQVWTDPSYFDQTCVWDTVGSTQIYQAGLQHVVGNLILNLKYSFLNSGTVDTPRGSKLDNGLGQGTYSLKKTMYSDTDFWVVINGQTRVLYQGTLPWWEDTNQRHHVKLNGNYFAEKVLNGNHEFKAGGEFHDAAYLPQNIYPNHRLVYILAPGDPPNAPRPTIQKYDSNYDVFMAYTPRVGNIRSRRLNFYFQDTATYGKFTFNLGLRYDRIWFAFLDTVGAGYKHRVVGAPNGVADPIPQWEPFMGNLEVKGYKIDAMPPVFSPRLSVSYDLFGNGKTVLKASTAVYGPLLEGEQGTAFWPLSFRSYRVPFWDINGNYRPDIGEFDPLTPFEIDAQKANPPGPWVGWMGYGGFDKNDPKRTTTTAKYADDYKNPQTWEWTLTLEREIVRDFAGSLGVMYKRTFFKERALTYYSDGSIDTGANYKPIAYDAETDNWVFSNVKGGGVGTIFTNYDKTYDDYKALKFELTKRLSNKWMLAASLVLQDWRNHLALSEQLVPEGYKPTNWEFYKDAPFALGALNEGYFIHSRWVFKINGLIQLPLGFNFSWNMRAREGYPVDRGYPVKNFYGEWLQPKGKKFGQDRLPTNYIVNIALDKEFVLAENIRATLMFNFFNATNHLNVEKKEWRPGPRQGSIINVSNPGVLQFGCKVSF